MMKKIMMVKASLFTGLAAITVQAATYHVSPNGNDGDGLSWATAKTTIQAAINLAQTAGDEVVVTNGTYGVISVNDDRAITIRSVNGAAVTVINGNNGSRCATLGGSAAHTNIVLSGFTLRNGYVSVMGGGGVVYGTLNNCTLTNNMVSGSFVYGGGAYYSRLNNCTLAGNTVTGINAQGGGAYQSTLSNCLLTNNTATGIFCYGGGAYNSTLDHCTLTGNMAIGQGSEDDSCCGGGAYNSTLNNCTLTGNTADEGGGVAYSTLDTCVLAGNTATDYGGGAYYSTLDNCMLTGNTAYAGGGAYSGTLDNCTLTGNTALGGGGACLGTLVNCTLTGNTATYYGGGSMFSMLNTCTLINNTADYEGGGVDNGTLNNCLLTGNTATSGGGASFTRLNNCVVTNNMAGHSGGGSYFGALNNCLLAGNTATDYAGGACDGTLVNCTLWGNTADEGGGSVSSKLRNCILWENFAIGVYSYYPNYQASPYGSLEYSCTVTTAPGGAGNIAQDPMFVDAANGDFRLQLDSPCINAGNNAYVAGAFDLDGNQRITYGTVDMGAYEMLQPTRYYVSPNGDDTDGLTWATAKTTIQAAIALTMMMEDEIVVTNGTYGAFSVTDDRVITIRSVEGAEHTVIDGNGTDRCATLGSDAAHTNTSLTGFTLRNGYAADFGGGAAYGTLNNCMLTNNTAAYGGGAAYGALANCLLVDNSAENEGGG
ncbi:MAG: hypothetical protein FWH21_08080, partial [Kiritimatiellaeota bacterium]|nr:hypothetical protein [Kiritimatiellota bacterium]